MTDAHRLEPSDSHPRAAPDAIRGALVGAVARRRGRTRTRAKVLLATGVVMLVGVGVLSGGELSNGPPRALAIERGDESIAIRVLDEGADGGALTGELAAAGIDATVRVIPAPDQFAGAWMGVQRVAGPGSKAPEAPTGSPVTAPGITARGSLLRVSLDAPLVRERGRWVIYLGRAPRASEIPLTLDSSGPAAADGAR